LAHHSQALQAIDLEHDRLKRKEVEMKSNSRMLKLLRLIPGIGTLLIFADASTQEFQDEFNLTSRKLSSVGEAKYFVLVTGFQIVLGSKTAKLTVTVLNETKEIGGITTRVLEEREEIGGALAEISRNYYAIDPVTKDVFYFGEDVDFYKDGQVINHNGSWIAYEGNNKPGLIMPGTPKIGMKYAQEVAPGVAMDRAQVLTVSDTLSTPAGKFENGLTTKETSALETVVEYKSYVPGIGFAADQNLKLISYKPKTR
jgi:hypothetical protein